MQPNTIQALSSILNVAKSKSLEVMVLHTWNLNPQRWRQEGQEFKDIFILSYIVRLRPAWTLVKKWHHVKKSQQGLEKYQNRNQGIGHLKSSFSELWWSVQHRGKIIWRRFYTYCKIDTMLTHFKSVKNMLKPKEHCRERKGTVTNHSRTRDLQWHWWGVNADLCSP